MPRCCWRCRSLLTYYCSLGVEWNLCFKQMPMTSEAQTHTTWCRLQKSSIGNLGRLHGYRFGTCWMRYGWIRSFLLRDSKLSCLPIQHPPCYFPCTPRMLVVVRQTNPDSSWSLFPAFLCCTGNWNRCQKTHLLRAHHQEFAGFVLVLRPSTCFSKRFLHFMPQSQH